MFGLIGDPPAAAVRRQALADWMVARENPWFARAAVERFFIYLLGKPIPLLAKTGNHPKSPLYYNSAAFFQMATSLPFARVATSTPSPTLRFS